MTPGSSVSRRRGMTLIELLLALALFLLLGLFVTQVMTAVLGIWQAGERRGQGDLAFEAAVDRFQGDLDALYAGRRGWLILDRWQPQPPPEGEAPWTLPRLRFLARGEDLPGDDPTGRGGVEIAWMLVPEDPLHSRLSRLVRISQPEDPAASLASDRVVEGLARNGAGTVVLDGVAWMDLESEGPLGRRDRLSIPADQPFDFPARLRLRVERISVAARRRPAHLDDALDPSALFLVLRGQPPARPVEYLLIDREWLKVSGDFPRLRVAERGARDSLAAAHDRTAAVLLPEVYTTTLSLPGGGRRLDP